MTNNTQTNIESEEYERLIGEYTDYMSTYATNIVDNLFSQGIVKEVEKETLVKYFANPDTHQKEIEDIAQYYYIASGEIHQLFELIESLPTLNYKLDSFDKSKTTEKYSGTLNKTLNKVKHKRLTRDILKQNAAAGTLVGMWLGDKTSPYPFIFDNVKYVFPAYRLRGEWQCVIDMDWIHQMNEFARENYFKNLSPHITKKEYEQYLKDPTNNRYFALPQEITFVVNTGTLKRNQALGTSIVTSGLYDVLHKKKLKDVEHSIANKIINAVAVLTVGVNGSKDYDRTENLNIAKAVKQKIHTGVKAALEKNSQSGVNVVTIPNFAELNFPDIKTDGLDGKKFDHINSDIHSAYGISSSVLNGDGGNFASAKLNFDTIYKKLSVMLENIEQEVYLKLFNLVLPASQKDNFKMEYDKEPPLTLKEKIDILMKMNDKGWSTKHVVDAIGDVSWDSYLDQTMYETNTLKLQDKIKPFQSTHTMTNDSSGRNGEESPDNENTIKSKSNDGNNVPS
ncbi:hypothetical protein LCM23_06215 [Cytobacillus kochii]|uniref:hypothetical protein n=1 Tax=Cytobacillus kochii TaxID=859143 RepID=UPI001CD6EB63|nr:hypothetical protein [Cytobacillus kochii]MCA1025679.1 hypothetical protein [Cytobacillus kochii]